MKSNKVALAVLAGFAAGAIFGVLFAPDKGSVTRRKIAKTGQKYADGLGETFDDFIESVTEQLTALQQETVDAVERMKTKTEDIET